MVNWLIVFRVPGVLLCIGALLYFALRIWRHGRNQETNNSGIDFHPSIGFTRLDGCASLALLMLNKSDSNVWGEEIEIVLTDLLATDQTCEASHHETQKIRQTVQPHDMLPISLVETIYTPAGKPQRKYSCVMSAIIRYRAGEEWFEKPLQPHRLRMAGLRVVSNHREQWTKSGFKTQEKFQDLQTAGTKSK
jgi:hypothetical protein